jgi:hypothetical protein
MLETTDGGRRAVLESEHTAGTCAIGHDHSICIQAGANRTLAPSGLRIRLPLLAIAFAAPAGAAQVYSAALERGHSTRAPPVIA